MPQSILVDLLSFTGTRGGTETYAREIVTRLPASLPDARFTALVGRAGADRVRAFFPGQVHVAGFVGDDRVTWAAGEVLMVNRLARRLRVDAVWSPANFGPITYGRPRVTTVHDLIYHGRSGVVPRISAWLLNRAALSSELVITGSFAARDAIVSDIGVARDRIIVIPHGTNAASVPADPWSEVAALDIARGRSILFSTGNRLPHKNFEGLLYALASIPSAERPLTVIAGGRGEDPLRPLVTRLGLEDDVVLPGWVSPTQLESLYAVADLYVCPSLLEGFGLPVIDAMRRGCIVLANDVPVLREVGGEAAFYADATKAEAFASAIRSALASDDTGRRNAGRHRSMAFTWEASAERTAETLRQAYSSSVRNAG